ncbi:hypothetical protein Ancab_011916 [Ancistrocladus abbreviatus]
MWFQVVFTVPKKELSSSSTRWSTLSSKGSTHGKGGNGGGIGDLVMINEEKGVFGLADLMKAAAEVLGNGGIGLAYKAMMAHGVAVAEKRMKEMNSDQGPSQAELDWHVRVRTIQGITQGMAYLHTELSSYGLPHGNLKSSNILISKENEPLIAEYGFSSLTNSGNLTRSNKRGGIDVVQWVVSAVAENREAELLNSEIASSENSKDEMVQLLRIGVACSEANVDVWPDMQKMLRQVEEIHVVDQRTIKLVPSLRDGIC